MGNKVRGQISADFDGGRINLILSTNAICELEDADGRSIGEVLDEIGGAKPRMKAVRLMFWAMMLDEKPDATIADAGRLIDGLRGDHDRVMTDAILAAFPDANTSEGDAPGK